MHCSHYLLTLNELLLRHFLLIFITNEAYSMDKLRNKKDFHPFYIQSGMPSPILAPPPWIRLCLDRFSRFCTTHPCAQHADTQTRHAWHSNRPHLCTAYGRCA